VIQACLLGNYPGERQVFMRRFLKFLGSEDIYIDGVQDIEKQTTEGSSRGRRPYTPFDYE
jgi:hypothetical protein